MQELIRFLRNPSANRKSTANYTAALNPTTACVTGMLITINSVSLSWPNGSQTGLTSQDEGGFAACIVPDWPMAINLHLDDFEDFESATNTMSTGRSAGINFWGMLYPNDETYVTCFPFSCQPRTAFG